MKPPFPFLTACAALVLSGLPLRAALDAAKIDQLTGLKGTWIEAEQAH